jgi:5'-methylthioadenosine phosphorylase
MSTAGKNCACVDALKYAILTDRTVIPVETRKKLAILLDKYL